MRKEDYQNTALYTHSEWRHAINIRAGLDRPVENIIVKGFHIEKSGGDRICVSGVAGYPKVIYEVQYADAKVYVMEDTQATYTFTIPTAEWERGIYLIKAIAVSAYLETKNIAVIPFEIISSIKEASH